jgi:hypothetical protein
VTEPDDVDSATAAGDTSDAAGAAPARPTATATGVPAADAARERLEVVDGVPLEEHVEVYEDVHRRLQEGLADLDER